MNQQAEKIITKGLYASCVVIGCCQPACSKIACMITINRLHPKSKYSHMYPLVSFQVHYILMRSSTTDLRCVGFFVHTCIKSLVTKEHGHCNIKSLLLFFTYYFYSYLDLDCKIQA
jgi:hypothetical protein